MRRQCEDCGGPDICEHRKFKYRCKECGTDRKLLKGGFTSEQIKSMGAIRVCQFPNCLIQENGKSLKSDHFHDGDKINPNNYRGEVCHFHHKILALLDRFPKWANTEAQEYMKRRPLILKGQIYE
jgi:hypothetical protein